MKKTIILFALILWASACTVTQIQPAQTSHNDIPFVPLDQLPPEEDLDGIIPLPPGYRAQVNARAAAQNNAWFRPGFRSYRLLPTYYEVCYDLFVKFGGPATLTIAQREQRTLDSLRKWVQWAGDISEKYGIGTRPTIHSYKIWTTPDPYAKLRNNRQKVDTFWVRNMGHPATFHKLLDNAPHGGIAYYNRNIISPSTGNWAYCGFNNLRPLPPPLYSYPIYNILHEGGSGHTVGMWHSHGDGWVDSTGRVVGRIDSCFACERNITPISPNCNGFTKSMDGGINGYCFLYGRLFWFVHPICAASAHRALAGSTLPTYTPSVPVPPTPQPITATWTFSGTTLSGAQTNVYDGNTDTRWVTTGRSSVTIAYSDSSRVNTLRIVSGYFSNNTWGSPIQPVRVLADGVVVFSATTSKVDTTIRINRRVRNVVIEGNDGVNNRWREVIIN